MSDEPSLEELALLLDTLEREYAAANDERRRRDIAIEISELTLRLNAFKYRPSRKS
jgi:hypothetical protein